MEQNSFAITNWKKWLSRITIAATILILGVGCGGESPKNQTVTPPATEHNDTNNNEELPIRTRTAEIITTDSSRSVTLPDSSNIILNENSKISFNEEFEGEERRVDLEGEAYFEVKRSTSKKFTVYAGNTKTTVVGTSFNVKETEDKVEVTVLEGEVKVEELENKENTVNLTKEGKATYNKKDRSIKKGKSKGDKFKWWESKVGKGIKKEIKKGLNNLLKKIDN